MVYKRFPNLDFLRVFGCLCFATRVNNNDKFFERAKKFVLIGYSAEKKGYKLLSLDSGAIFFSKDVKFYITIFPFKMSLGRQVMPQSKDPFSNDEPEIFHNVIIRIDLGSLDTTRESDYISAVHPLVGTDFVPSCLHEFDTWIPQTSSVFDVNDDQI